MSTCGKQQHTAVITSGIASEGDDNKYTCEGLDLMVMPSSTHCSYLMTSKQSICLGPEFNSTHPAQFYRWPRRAIKSASRCTSMLPARGTRSECYARLHTLQLKDVPGRKAAAHSRDCFVRCRSAAALLFVVLLLAAISDSDAECESWQLHLGLHKG